MSETKTITIVVPFLNEKDNLPVLLERVRGVFSARAEDWELLLVDDGSTDGSTEWALEQARADRHVRVVRLSRNFGHQLAITAGLDRADGDAVVVMDADLQDPPETIGSMIDQWREGAEVVYAVRRSRAGDGWMKNFWRRDFTGCSAGWRRWTCRWMRGFPAGGPLRGGRAEGDARTAPVHAGADVLGGVPAGGGGIRPRGALRGRDEVSGMEKRAAGV